MKFLKIIFKAFTVLLGFVWGIFEFVLDTVRDDETSKSDKKSFEELRVSRSPEHRLIFGNIWKND